MSVTMAVINEVARQSYDRALRRSWIDFKRSMRRGFWHDGRPIRPIYERGTPASNRYFVQVGPDAWFVDPDDDVWGLNP